jgi:hypothetical protein
LLNPRVVWGGAALLAPVSFGLGTFVGGELGSSGAEVALRLAGFVLFLGLGFAFLWGIVQGVRHLRIRDRTVERAHRQRILWAVLGFFLAMWAIFIGLAGLVPAALATLAVSGGWVWPVLPILALAAAPLLIVAFLAVAIFYDGAVDPALVIQRMALYGVSGVVLTFLFAGVENLASSALAGRLGLPEASASWIAAGTVAVVLGLARHGMVRLLGPLVARLTSKEATESAHAPPELAVRNVEG